MYNEKKEFAEKIVQVHRVSKKTKGGNKIGFSVVVVVGDKKGRVGVGLGKAPDVKNAIKKGVRYAEKHLITVPLTKVGSIPHDIYLKQGAAKVLLRKAPEGTGVIAGGAIRAVVEAAGVTNIVSKVLGTSNQASNVYATLEALSRLRPERGNSKQKTDEGKIVNSEIVNSKKSDDDKQGNTEAQNKIENTEKTENIRENPLPAEARALAGRDEIRENPSEDKKVSAKNIEQKKIRKNITKK